MWDGEGGILLWSDSQFIILLHTGNEEYIIVLSLMSVKILTNSEPKVAFIFIYWVSQWIYKHPLMNCYCYSIKGPSKLATWCSSYGTTVHHGTGWGTTFLCKFSTIVYTNWLSSTVTLNLHSTLPWTNQWGGVSIY